jgi:hypothetical protein
VTAVVDTVAHTGSITTIATETPAACAFTVDSLNAALTTIANPNTVITITGAPSLVTESATSWSWGDPDAARAAHVGRAPLTSTQTGAFTYSTSDGRSGTCQVDIESVFDPAARTHTVTGTFCGQAIEVTNTLPMRRGRR